MPLKQWCKISLLFQILEDTLLGYRLSPWRRSKNRRLIETEKFYLFDVGVANYLANRKPQPKTPEFGQSFEHFIYLELKAYQAYCNPELPLYYWRTSSGSEPKKIGEITCLPWEDFLKRLWAQAII